MAEVKNCTVAQLFGDTWQPSGVVSNFCDKIAFGFLSHERKLLRGSDSLSVHLLKRLCVLSEIHNLLILNQVFNSTAVLFHVRALEPVSGVALASGAVES